MDTRNVILQKVASRKKKKMVLAVFYTGSEFPSLFLLCGPSFSFNIFRCPHSAHYYRRAIITSKPKQIQHLLINPAFDNSTHTLVKGWRTFRTSCAPHFYEYGLSPKLTMDEQLKKKLAEEHWILSLDMLYYIALFSVNVAYTCNVCIYICIYFLYLSLSSVSQVSP